MRYFLTVKYFLEGNRKAFFHYKRKTKRRTTRSLLNERTGYACSFINFLLDCFPATHCNFIAQTPTCPTNQLAIGSPTVNLRKLLSAHKSHVRKTTLFTGAIRNPICTSQTSRFVLVPGQNPGRSSRGDSVVLRLQSVMMVDVWWCTSGTGIGYLKESCFQ